MVLELKYNCTVCMCVCVNIHTHTHTHNFFSTLINSLLILFSSIHSIKCINELPIIFTAIFEKLKLLRNWKKNHAQNGGIENKC